MNLIQTVLPDTTVWSYDNGFARNEEAQWYQKGNAYCKDGKLIIEARKKKDVKIPGMRPEVMTGGRSGSLLSTLPPCSLRPARRVPVWQIRGSCQASRERRGMAGYLGFGQWYGMAFVW